MHFLYGDHRCQSNTARAAVKPSSLALKFATKLFVLPPPANEPENVSGSEPRFNPTRTTKSTSALHRTHGLNATKTIGATIVRAIPNISSAIVRSRDYATRPQKSNLQRWTCAISQQAYTESPGFLISRTGTALRGLFKSHHSASPARARWTRQERT